MKHFRILAVGAIVSLLSVGAAALADTMTSSNSMSSHSMSMSSGTDHGKDYLANGMIHGRFGGPVYTGAPALDVTAALVKAGGGAANYSTATALVSMVGKPTVNAEVAKLTKQYGAAAVTSWLKTFDFAVDDSLKIATAAGIKLPAPAPLTGKSLAVGLVKAGVDTTTGDFQIELLLDKAVSHKIHVQVMNDIDKEPGLGKAADLSYHEISNQAFYDLAQALGAKSVMLAPIH